MRVVFLAADDPIYLPDFFERVLAARASDTLAVYVTPPLYRDQTSGSAAWRYFRTFGLADTLRLSGRVLGARLRRRSIGAVCRKHGVRYAVVPDVNAPVFLDLLRSQSVDTIVSVSCPQIFRKPLREIPSRGLLNVHGAVLPEYRGVMPGFWMLANGERRAGVSIFFVSEEIDAGVLCGQEVFEIDPAESLDAFLRRSKRVAADLVLSVLTAIEHGRVESRPLERDAGSYYSWPSREAVERFRAAGRRVW